MKVNNEKIHLSGYQARDVDITDYEMYELDNTGLCFRGPNDSPYSPGEYFTCIGAAQTFGCFCDSPYPKLLSDNLGVKALNLGYGGAGPEFYNNQPGLLEYINNGKFIVVQAMSGRSQSNSLFDCNGLEYLTRKSDGKEVGANEAYSTLLKGPSWLSDLPPKKVTRYLSRRIGTPKLKALVDETRSNWVDNQIELFNKISVPIIFLWFSKRSPDYVEEYRSVRTLFGEFPQLINKKSIEKVSTFCAHYVEVITDRGSPQPLFNRFTGQATTVNPLNDRKDLAEGDIWTHNLYYPSPQMQEDAANALLPICKKYV